MNQKNYYIGWKASEVQAQIYCQEQIGSVDEYIKIVSDWNIKVKGKYSDDQFIYQQQLSTLNFQLKRISQIHDVAQVDTHLNRTFQFNQKFGFLKFISQVSLLEESYLRRIIINRNLQNGICQVLIHKNGMFSIVTVDDMIPINQQGESLWGISKDCVAQLILLKVCAKIYQGFFKIEQAKPFEIMSLFSLPHCQKIVKLQHNSDMLLQLLQCYLNKVYRLYIKTKSHEILGKYSLPVNCAGFQLIKILQINETIYMAVKSPVKCFIQYKELINHKTQQIANNQFLVLYDDFCCLFSCILVQKQISSLIKNTYLQKKCTQLTSFFAYQFKTEDACKILMSLFIPGKKPSLQLTGVVILSKLIQNQNRNQDDETIQYRCEYLSTYRSYQNGISILNEKLQAGKYILLLKLNASMQQFDVVINYSSQMSLVLQQETDPQNILLYLKLSLINYIKSSELDSLKVDCSNQKINVQFINLLNQFHGGVLIVKNNSKSIVLVQLNKQISKTQGVVLLEKYEEQNYEDQVHQNGQQYYIFQFERQRQEIQWPPRCIEVYRN